MLVTKADCPLCDEAVRLVERYASRFKVGVEVVDIATSDELGAEFAERVPVLLAVGHQVLAEGRMTPFTVQRALLRVRLGL